MLRAGTLSDLSGNGRDAVLTVLPSTGSQRQGWAGRYLMLGSAPLFFFFINLKPLKKLSTTNYAPFALDM